MLFTSLTASSHMSCSHTRNSNLKYQVQGQVVRTLATAAAPLLYHYHCQRCQRRFAVARPGSITGQRLFFFKPTVNVWPFVLQNWVPRPNYFQIFPYFFPLMYKFIHLLVDVGALFSAASTTILILLLLLARGLKVEWPGR